MSGEFMKYGLSQEFIRRPPMRDKLAKLVLYETTMYPVGDMTPESFWDELAADSTKVRHRAIADQILVLFAEDLRRRAEGYSPNSGVKIALKKIADTYEKEL